MKLDTASCSLLMTTLTQAKNFNFKGDDLKTDVNHIYVRVCRDATREGVKYCSQRELLSWSDVQYSTSQNTNAYD